MVLFGHETYMLCFLRTNSLLGTMIGLGSFLIKSHNAIQEEDVWYNGESSRQELKDTGFQFWC